MCSFVHPCPLFGAEVHFFRLCGVQSFGAVRSKVCYKRINMTASSFVVVVPRIEELNEYPLRPFVVGWVRGLEFTRPVQAETNVVELLAVACGIYLRCFLWMLTRLDGILLSRQSKGIIAHRVQDVKALLLLVTTIDIRGDVAQRVTYVQTRTRWIREHVQNIEFWLVL